MGEADGTRTERDSMGTMEVPADALWGASTQRAVLNFPVSGEPMPASFVAALGEIKRAAALANRELDVLDAERAGFIVDAATEVADGRLDAHFPVDVFQTGSGTSSNMKATEVIANRAAQLRGSDEPRLYKTADQAPLGQRALCVTCRLDPGRGLSAARHP